MEPKIPNPYYSPVSGKTTLLFDCLLKPSPTLPISCLTVSELSPLQLQSAVMHLRAA